jgi:hypothetical protein
MCFLVFLSLGGGASETKLKGGRGKEKGKKNNGGIRRREGGERGGGIGEEKGRTKPEYLILIYLQLQGERRMLIPYKNCLGTTRALESGRR